MTTAELRERHPALWASATRDPFLDAACDGSLPQAAFSRWLEQDYLFVEGLTRAWGRMLESAPLADFELIAAGVGAFTAELGWFEELAEERALRLGGAPAQPAADYIAFLGEIARAPYPVAIAAMWAVEAAYLEAWRGALGGSETYAAVIRHWANDEFATFVDRLTRAADRELLAAPSRQKDAEDAFKCVLEHESAFWAIGRSA